MVTIASLSEGTITLPLKATLCHTTPIIKTKNNNNFVKVALADPSGSCAALIFNESLLEKIQEGVVGKKTIRVKNFRYQNPGTVIIGERTSCTIMSIPSDLSQDQIIAARAAMFEPVAELTVASRQKKTSRVSTRGKIKKIYPRATSAKAKRIILTSNNSDVTCTLWEPHCNGDIKEGNDLVLYDVRVTEHGLETMAGSYLEETQAAVETKEMNVTVIGSGFEGDKPMITILRDGQEEDYVCEVPLPGDDLPIEAKLTLVNQTVTDISIC